MKKAGKNILQNCIYNVFLALDIVFKPMFPDLGKCYQKDQSRVLFGKFMSLLAKNFHVKRDVRYYADRLCITTDYLYKITCKIEQRTPKEIIDLFVVTELKRYLDNTEQSVKDLAVCSISKTRRTFAAFSAARQAVPFPNTATGLSRS